MLYFFSFFFFFQAEDGIRDLTVTGVQTCALPIFGPVRQTEVGHLEFLAPVESDLAFVEHARIRELLLEKSLVRIPAVALRLVRKQPEVKSFDGLGAFGGQI